MMAQVEAGRFTVGVFQDVASAGKGIDALIQRGFPPEGLSLIGKDVPEVTALIERTLGGPGARIEIDSVGTVLARGGILEALNGTDSGLERLGMASAMARVGFQMHDGQIFGALVARGGVLVAVRSEPRAADALATLFSYGGGNAAIGAWTGRL
jgi:hypothetical protein